MVDLYTYSSSHFCRITSIYGVRIWLNILYKERTLTRLIRKWRTGFFRGTRTRHFLKRSGVDRVKHGPPLNGDLSRASTELGACDRYYKRKNLHPSSKVDTACCSISREKTKPPIYGAEDACFELQNAGIHNGDLELELGTKLLISFCDTLKSHALSLSFSMDSWASAKLEGFSLL